MDTPKAVSFRDGKKIILKPDIDPPNNKYFRIYEEGRKTYNKHRDKLKQFKTLIRQLYIDEIINEHLEDSLRKIVFSKDFQLKCKDIPLFTISKCDCQIYTNAFDSSILWKKEEEMTRANSILMGKEVKIIDKISIRSGDYNEFGNMTLEEIFPFEKRTTSLVNNLKEFNLPVYSEYYSTNKDIPEHYIIYLKHYERL